MPSVSSCLTWALEVDAIEACGHFEAYLYAKEVIETLELCNRFGQGSQAYITRVPAEVIQSIGGFVTGMEREEALDFCYQEEACWSGTCDSMDHFDSEDIELMYDRHFDGEGGPCNCHRKAGSKNSAQTSDCETFLNMVEDAGLEYEIHPNRSNEWEQRIGSSRSGDHGVFDTYKRLLLKDFGLRIWTLHTQSDHQAPKAGQPTHKHVSKRKTRVWLTLPDSRNITKNYNEQEPDRWWFDESRYIPTESGYEFSIVLPEKPSKKSLKRWPRALRILGLEEIASNAPKLYASKMDKDAATAKQSAIMLTLNGSDRMAGANVHGLPELKLLVSCRSEPSDREW